MPKTLDSLIVLWCPNDQQTGNTGVLQGEKCLVRIYVEPEAEEQTFSRVDLDSMTSTPASDIIERKRGAVELSAPYHSFAWGVKRNGRPQGRWSGKHITIAKVEDAAGASLARLFPNFKDADDNRWGSVINRAKNGDEAAMSAERSPSWISLSLARTSWTVMIRSR